MRYSNSFTNIVNLKGWLEQVMSSFVLKKTQISIFRTHLNI